MQKVAVYCRVSTEKGDQVNSLESQKKFFHNYIEQNPNWELYDIYADEGITGTSTKKRFSFHKMIQDAENHEFDIIITKEISRFARNTLDSIYFTRKLKELGIAVIFMNDNINTLDADAELRLTIMSSFAQEESRKTSERVKWGQRRRMEQGVVFGRDMLGYDVRNGRLIVNEEGAKIVRKIFHKFVNEGKGTYTIARELKEEGTPTCNHMKEWSNVVIQRILKNEKYAGDLIQKKTYTPNYLTHEKKYNRGEEEFVILHNHHEPIISRDLFEKAKKELSIRSAKKDELRKYSNRYCLSGKLLCGICGSSFVARTKKRKDGTRIRSWKCYKALRQGTCFFKNDDSSKECNAHILREEDVKLFLQEMVKEMPVNKEAMVKHLLTLLKNTNSSASKEYDIEDLHKQTLKIKEKRVRLVEMHLLGDISRSEFIQLREKFEKEEEELNAKLKEAPMKERLLKDTSMKEAPMIECALKDTSMKGTYMKARDNDGNPSSYEQISDFLLRLLDGECWEDAFYQNLLDKIIITDNKKLEVYLKS